jgi:hypothetical protein
LILRADVQRLRDIANIRMRFAKQTYLMYKEIVPQQAQDNMQLIRLRMKTCMKHYHAVLPQLDLIATQWGKNIDDTLAQNDEGSLRSEAARQRQTTVLDNQLREQIRDVRKTQVREQDRIKREKMPTRNHNLPDFFQTVNPLQHLSRRKYRDYLTRQERKLKKEGQQNLRCAKPRKI